MPDNKPLLAAARGRADEFYTRYEDVERGLTPFRDAFRGADVLLDTNDGDWSAFWHFLSDRFYDWGLSRLRSLSHDPTADMLFASDDAGGRLYERTAAGVTERRLEGSGSFDSPEARAIAREADLTVGNPPFSLAGRYLSGHAGRGLLCLGPMTACSYSDVFPLFMAGRLHICSPNKGSMFFRVPGYKDLDRADAVHIEPDGVPAVGVKGVVWYTDLPGGCPTFTPTHAYDPADNPFYDNLPHDIKESRISLAFLPVREMVPRLDEGHDGHRPVAALRLRPQSAPRAAHGEIGAGAQPCGPSAPRAGGAVMEHADIARPRPAERRRRVIVGGDGPSVEEQACRVEPVDRAPVRAPGPQVVVECDVPHADGALVESSDGGGRTAIAERALAQSEWLETFHVPAPFFCVLSMRPDPHGIQARAIHMDPSPIRRSARSRATSTPCPRRAGPTGPPCGVGGAPRRATGGAKDSISGQ